MLAPIDKVRNGGNDTIQIVITRNCDIFNCSECTQLLPFRKDAAREMSLECIEESLIALKGWPGIIACFGGNPCTHSRFPEVCELWKKHVPFQHQRGLWANNLMKYGQECRDTFWPAARFNLNVHGNEDAARVMAEWLPGIKVWGMKPSNHGGQLLDYSDFGITDDDWYDMRERCDINQKWSGAIYQRDDGKPYMYFCERAGALDGVRGTNNGIRVEPGCWEWGMKRFQPQVSTCCDHVCGVPLRTKGYVDSADTYGISSSLVQLAIPQRGNINIEVHDTMPETTYELTDYQGLRAQPESK